MIGSPLRFRCNICSRENVVDPASLGRDTSSCERCRSSVRTRSIVHALSVELFGRCLPIAEFPRRKDIRGCGLSDLKHYARRLKRRLGYTNTFFHRRPRLDIANVPREQHGTLDFLISTDVFEHVVPPVQVAFDNARKILGPGGLFVFSVPYGNEGETLEHFPNLHDYRYEKDAGERVLVNRTREGTTEVFRDLVFHGGDGEVLEMRVFSLEDLRDHFQAAGFTEMTIWGDDHEDCGVVHEHPWSLTITARAPAS